MPMNGFPQNRLGQTVLSIYLILDFDTKSYTV